MCSRHFVHRFPSRPLSGLYSSWSPFESREYSGPVRPARVVGEDGVAPVADQVIRCPETPLNVDLELPAPLSSSLPGELSSDRRVRDGRYLGIRGQNKIRSWVLNPRL